MSEFVRIWNADDEGKSFIHLMADGRDFTICGHDAVEAADPVAHLKPCKPLTGRRRVTCPHCLSIIETVRDYLEKP